MSTCVVLAAPALALPHGRPLCPSQPGGGSGAGGGSLTGLAPPSQGRFTDTVMYYGYYSNTTLNQPCAPPPDGGQCTPEGGGLPYNMPLAYLFTVGAAFFITCITLVYR